MKKKKIYKMLKKIEEQNNQILKAVSPPKSKLLFCDEDKFARDISRSLKFVMENQDSILSKAEPSPVL